MRRALPQHIRVPWLWHAVTCSLARWLCGLLLLSICSTGCVSRRMTIVSHPPGALVLLEGKEVGYTPVSVDFTYYGTREITLIKEGYEPLTVLQPVPAPWYQWPVIEFFADNLALSQLSDRQKFVYHLQPTVPVSTRDLLNRADMLRQGARLSP